MDIHRLPVMTAQMLLRKLSFPLGLIIAYVWTVSMFFTINSTPRYPPLCISSQFVQTHDTVCHIEMKFPLDASDQLQGHWLPSGPLNRRGPWGFPSPSSWEFSPCSPVLALCFTHIKSSFLFISLLRHRTSSKNFLRKGTWEVNALSSCMSENVFILFLY